MKLKSGKLGYLKEWKTVILQQKMRRVSREQVIYRFRPEVFLAGWKQWVASLHSASQSKRRLCQGAPLVRRGRVNKEALQNAEGYVSMQCRSLAAGSTPYTRSIAPAGVSQARGQKKSCGMRQTLIDPESFQVWCR